MGKASQRLSQLIPNGLMLMVYLSRISALAAFIILIDLRGIIPRAIIYYSLGICIPSFLPVNMSYLPVRAFREETEKPSLTSLSLTLLMNLFHLIGAWIAFGLMLTSHFWPTDTLTPNRIWFLWGQVYLWPTLVIGLLREYVTTQDKKKKKKALREAEKKDPQEAEKPDERDSIAEPVSGLCLAAEALCSDMHEYQFVGG
ncbi:unnamed protein product [Clonostachys rhizophaga]|uniref:Uncharacterized protein n=1 Tax=Clonostachys rhizophaga TaxID=160324 RepID=A0A9N9V8X4_9HYPO|nr:unnamed protein product [Clonostachys rhizophaga]